MGVVDIRGPLTTWVYTQVVGNSTVMAAVGNRVYENVPHETIYPYIEIGEIQSFNTDTHSNERFEGQVTLNVWSRYKGSKEANDILDKINKVLHDNTVCVGSLTTVRFTRSFSTTLKDSDGSTIQGVIRYDYLLGG